MQADVTSSNELARSQNSSAVALALLLAGVTGACALVYEVVWQRYLAILLGAQSEATAAVLALFLGGLSVRYAVFGRVAQRSGVAGGATHAPAQIVRIYGLCEVAIGLLAWGFSGLFKGVQLLSTALPALPEGLAFALDVLLASALLATCGLAGCPGSSRGNPQQAA